MRINDFIRQPEQQNSKVYSLWGRWLTGLHDGLPGAAKFQGPWVAKADPRPNDYLPQDGTAVVFVKHRDSKTYMYAGVFHVRGGKIVSDSAGYSEVSWTYPQTPDVVAAAAAHVAKLFEKGEIVEPFPAPSEEQLASANARTWMRGYHKHARSPDTTAPEKPARTRTRGTAKAQPQPQPSHPGRDTEAEKEPEPTEDFAAYMDRLLRGG